VLGDQTGQEIASKHQPRLLSYFLRNANNVRDSKFDVPSFTMPMRELARILGACVPDDPQLQSELIELLRERDEEVRFEDSHDFRPTVIEALLYFFHKKSKHSVQVQEIAEAANALLKNRGESFQLNPRAVGEILRSIDFATIRLGSAGRGIRLLRDGNLKIHRLAADFQVPTIMNASNKCDLCKEFVARQNDDGKRVQ